MGFRNRTHPARAASGVADELDEIGSILRDNPSRVHDAPAAKALPVAVSTAEPDAPYITVVELNQLFADHQYQRELDLPRVRKMALTWNVRLLGVLEVSDRGDDGTHTARYAVMDGQHRMEAARRANVTHAAVNVHTGLTIAQEAVMFDQLNRNRKQTNTWDHWRARRLAGERLVLDIERIVEQHGLLIAMSPMDGRISCTSAMEKVVELGGLQLLTSTLSLLYEIWGRQRAAYEAPMIRGLASVMHYLKEPLSIPRLGDAMMETTPTQVRSHARSLKEFNQGAGHILTAMAIVAAYNKIPGRKILVSTATFGGVNHRRTLAAAERDER